MLKQPEPRPVAISIKIYGLLLKLYPKAHRKEYGVPMAQLFLDQCRDIWAEASGLGLMFLWLRTSLDLAKTLPVEHLQNLKERKCMFDKISATFRNVRSLRPMLLAGGVFLSVLVFSLLLALWTPKQYVSTARIKVEPTAAEGSQSSGSGSLDSVFMKNQCEILRSATLLGQVARKLDLAVSWSKQAAGKLSEAEMVDRLKGVIESRTVRDTGLVEIRAYSHDAVEASLIANTLAETYRDFRSMNSQESVGMQGQHLVEIVDAAMPGLRPVRPNKSLTLFFGLFGGVLMALLVFGLRTFLVRLNLWMAPPVATA